MKVLLWNHTNRILSEKRRKISLNLFVNCAERTTAFSFKLGKETLSKRATRDLAANNLTIMLLFELIDLINTCSITYYECIRK